LLAIDPAAPRSAAFVAAAADATVLARGVGEFGEARTRAAGLSARVAILRRFLRAGILSATLLSALAL
jgi:hypothetical protein